MEPEWRPWKWTHTNIVNYFDKGAKGIQCRKGRFFQQMIEQLDIHIQKKKKERETRHRPYTPLTKINLKWSKDWSIKHKTIKPLEDKIGEDGPPWWYSGHGFGWTPGGGDGQGGLAHCGSWGRKESDTTEPLSWTEQWIRTGLPTQGSWPGKDSICHGTTKAVHCSYWALLLQLLKPTHLQPVLHNKRSQCHEIPTHCSEE